MGGWIVNKDNPKEAYWKILSIVENEDYLDCVNNIKDISLKNTKSMAIEYIQIYNVLLDK